MEGTAPFRRGAGVAFGVAAAVLAMFAAAPCAAVDAPPGFVVENAFPGVIFDAPMQVVFLPDGRKLVAQLDGIVWAITAGGAKLPTPFIDLRAKVLVGNGRGLMSIALDPDFASDRWVYFVYTVDPDSNGADVEGEAFARLERYQAAAANPDVADLGTRQILIGGSWSDGIPMLDTFHTVGSLRFARDQSLLVASGDAAHFDATDAGGLDPNGFGPGKTDPSEDIGSFRSLSLNSYCGKILRVDKETGRGLPSNPYWNGDPDAVRSKVWLYGLRNPFRFGVRPGSGSADPSDGDPGTLYIGDVGWFTYEDLHITRQPGLNLGWPCQEGPAPEPAYQAVTATVAGNTNVLCSAPLNAENPAAPTAPQLWWHHTDPSLSNPPGSTGRTVLGGAFAGTPSYPAPFAGSFFVGEYTLSWIKAVQVDANDNVLGVTDFLANADHPADLEVDPASGDLFYCAIFAGEVRRVRYLHCNAGLPAMADLAASQVTAGNDTDGTIKLRLSFTRPPDAASVEVYRAPFGNYPEYDDPPAPGGPPEVPSYPPPPPWALTGITASGQTDEVATRDVWSYVAFSRDDCGHVSPVSNVTPGVPNYLLGDVTNSLSACAGNNVVSTADLSLLGAHYGITLGPSHPFACLDVGPTEDFSGHARPLTDDRVDFEDLVVFAINWSGPPAATAAAQTPAGASRGGAERVWAEAPPAAIAGASMVVPVMMHGAGGIQALSAALAWNPAVVEPVAAEAGALLPSAESLVLSATPGTVDVALLGARARGISGEGEIARVTFRVLRAGEPGIRVASVAARDARNHAVAMALEPAAREPRPDRVELRPALPNPFARTTTLEFALPAHAWVELDVYAVDGRRVRSLVRGPYDAGVYTVPWDGRDDHGHEVSAGVLFARLRAGGVARTRTLTCLR